MTCPMTPDWLMSRRKGIGKAPFPSLADDSSLPHHCPAHETIPYNDEYSGDLSVSCCLSGCCYLKKHSKINGILKKLSERNLCSDNEYVSSSIKDSTVSWCQKRTAYYNQRLILSEVTNEQILNRMRKRDLEILLYTLNENHSVDSEVSNISMKITAECKLRSIHSEKNVANNDYIFSTEYYFRPSKASIIPNNQNESVNNTTRVP